MPNICIGSDHRGYDNKSVVVAILTPIGYRVNDVGVTNSVPSDFADYASMVCENVLRGVSDFGILIDETGNGMAMVCNRTKAIRAFVISNPETAIKDASVAKRLYDANVLCFSNKIEPDTISECVNAYIEEEFQGGRQESRISELR